MPSCFAKIGNFGVEAGRQIQQGDLGQSLGSVVIDNVDSVRKPRTRARKPDSGGGETVFVGAQEVLVFCED